MNRFVILMCILLCACSSCAVKKVSKEPQTPLVVDTVISTNLTQKESYMKCLEWVATAYNSAQDVIQMSEESAATIVCKGVFEHQYGKSMTYGNLWGIIHYTLTIKCKDNRIRITTSQFKHEAMNPSPMILGTLGNVNTGSHPEYGHIKNVSQYWANLQEYCVSYTKENIVGKLQRHLENNEDDNW